MQRARPLTIGTAGHIDHGKTALVRALTGVDTDRLAEEKARGISIELGYARLDLPSGRRLSVVDVPGHERLVRTMVAGATGIDLYLAVVAADDGVMPQTREHAAVLSALGVRRGVVAVTKADLTDAVPDLDGLFAGAPVVAVSARDGRGLDELRAALDRVAGDLGARRADGEVRLHVDRVFTIHGAGTVVTGTLWSGTVRRGDEVALLPAGTRARVRAVQVHDEAVDRAEAGQRVALNLAGVRRDEVTRGDVVATGDLRPTHRVEARVGFTPPARVMVHHGTRESLARAVTLGDGLVQLRLDLPLMAQAGDRLVLRTIAPPDTLGGGEVTDAAPPRRSVLAPRPSGRPMPSQPAAAPSPAPAPAADPATEATLRAGWHRPPSDGELPAGDLELLRAAGRAVRIAAGLHIHADALEAARARLVELLDRDGAVTLAAFRDELGTSRRCAQALLEHFDSERLTLRRGDARVSRRRPGA